jgi:pyridoxamine 5'-phosphate oxidase-like protein
MAIDAGGAPHVTPVLFAVAQDRLWFAVARSTLKARALAKRPQVGVLLSDGSSAVMVGGTATLLDPKRPADLATAPELARAPIGLPSFGLSNVLELAGFARDSAGAPTRLSPTGLVLVSVRPRMIELTDCPPDPRSSRAAGAAAGTAWKRTLTELPPELAALARRPGPAVLGWLTPGGPIAVPATWEGDRARVRWSALTGLGAPPAGPACLCLDVKHGAGPKAKEGLLLRGSGRVNGSHELRSVVLRPRRITYWAGLETRTVDVAPRKRSGRTAAAA